MTAIGNAIGIPFRKIIGIPFFSNLGRLLFNKTLDDNTSFDSKNNQTRPNQPDRCIVSNVVADQGAVELSSPILNNVTKWAVELNFDSYAGANVFGFIVGGGTGVSNLLLSRSGAVNYRSAVDGYKPFSLLTSAITNKKVSLRFVSDGNKNISLYKKIETNVWSLDSTITLTTVDAGKMYIERLLKGYLDYTLGFDGNAYDFKFWDLTTKTSAWIAASFLDSNYEPTIDPDHRYLLNEGEGTVALDSGSSGTKIHGTYYSDATTIADTLHSTTIYQADKQNESDKEGYTIADGATMYYEVGLTNLIPINTIIPKDLANPTKCMAYDAIGQVDLQYVGSVKYNADVVGMPIAESAGSGVLTFTDLTGVTIVSSEGTATPTKNVNDIDIGAGTIWELLLSDGTRIVDPLFGYDVSGNDNHATPANLTVSTGLNLYFLTNGYQRYRHDTDAINNPDKLIPYKNDGTKISPAIANYTLYSDHPAKVVGNVYGNNEAGSIDFNPDSAITGFRPSRIFCKSDTDYFEAEILDFPDYTTDYVWTASTLFNTLMCLGSTTVRYSVYIAMTTADNVVDLQKNFSNLGVYLTQKTAEQMLQIASSGGWHAEWEMFNSIHFNSQFVSVIDTLLIDPFLDVSDNITKAMDWSSLRDHPVQATSTLRPLFNYNATARNMGFAGVDEYLSITSKSLDADFRVLIKKVSGVSYLMGSDANNYISHNSTSLDVKINGTLIDFIPLRTGITGVNCLIEIKRISGSVTAQAIKSDGTVISGGLPTVNSDTLTIDTIGGYNSANVAASEIENYAIEKATAGNLTTISDEILKQFAKI